MPVWPDKYSVRRNPFVEGLQNYRDFMYTEFRFSSRNTLPILAAMVIMPTILIAGQLATDNTKAAVYKRDFPNHALRTVEQRREEDRAKEEAEAGKDGEE